MDDFDNNEKLEISDEILNKPRLSTNKSDINFEQTVLEGEEDITEDKEEIYYDLLNKVYDKIDIEKELFSNKSINICKPIVKYENRKTTWENFDKNFVQINRDHEHLKKFIDKELGIKSSLNSKQNLIMRGKFDSKDICELLTKYIKNYVQCPTCRTINTSIVRNESRMDYLSCNNKKCDTQKVVQKV